MGQGQSGGLPSKQGGTGDWKGDANNKKEKKYECGTIDPRRQEAAEAEGTRSNHSLARGHACHQVQASTSEARSRVDGGGV
jgi:hypothetical protein